MHQVFRLNTATIGLWGLGNIELTDIWRQSKNNNEGKKERKKKKITWAEQLAVRPEGQYVKRCQPTKREVWCSCTSLQWVQIIKTMDLTHHTESKLGPCPLEEIRVMLFPLFYLCLLWTVVHVKLFKLWTHARDVAQATLPLWWNQCSSCTAI